MPIPSPATALLSASSEELIHLLLKQFQRLVAEKGTSLSAAEMKQIASDAALYQENTRIPTLILALQSLVQDSHQLIANRWKMDFASILTADVASLETWSSTADFLEIANEKSNAELRISAGSCLLAFLGDLAVTPDLMVILHADQGANDVDGIMARRALCHLFKIDPQAEDWLAQIESQF
ncbi:hypothetical protein MASR2M15_09490 [Anaerolineales bacterium]